MGKTRRIPLRMIPPTEYVVGTDLTAEQYADLIQKVGDWFAEWRNTKEPVALARTTIDRALKGMKPKDNTPWYEMSTAPMNARIRSACRFDMATMTPIRKGSEKVRLKKEQVKAKKARDQLAKREDPNIPDELRQDLRATAKYGDNPHVFLSTEEARRWTELRDGYLAQFPELRTINGEQELALLCDLLIYLERQRFKLLKGDKSQPTDAEEIARLTKQVSDIKKSLSIHPDQLSKRVKEDTSATIGSAIAKFEGQPNWRDVRARYHLEELMQAYAMYATLKADGSGYELDDVGLFGMTTCRTCHCASCGTKNFAGFEVHEIESHLVKKGMLEPIAAAPAEQPGSVASPETSGQAPTASFEQPEHLPIELAETVLDMAAEDDAC